ncbi:hypothetical protein DYB28_000038 [Aphanomyces astaci]|uniref:Ion transport domain-containing protein n=1 Tax=Aphanomyces astaci TaxID=112090 RepID=A0A397D1P9_APHAT|nr:hypothetical protein DYB25_000161 [Aphanomyces astaci]RHY33446.1 hypothetical protein DYB34_001338 [Aphanomyces astaci]RHY54225.1 hypothetical protein DYB38_001058 [Aphanomyces astaci]RHY66377.1 hypothetical protein DYB30_002718 [Aphanomyces astaci]RHY91257.1 hypothetical protein DYB26_001873 [Aphanomyces astaci]
MELPTVSSTSTSRVHRSLGNLVPRRFSRTVDAESFGSFVLEQGSLSWQINRHKTKTFDPDSMQASIWNTWLLFVVLYDAWVVPLVLCFDVINPDICHEAWLTTALMAFELFFIADIYVQMHTGYYIAGDLVRSPASTRRRYMSSYQFPIDVLALIPLPFFSIVPSTNHAASCGLVLLNKLLRLRRIPAYTLDFDKVQRN